MDVHIMIIPVHAWRQDLNYAYLFTCQESRSLGVIRIDPRTTLADLRDILDHQLDAITVLPRGFVYLFNTGRCLSKITTKQEEKFTVSFYSRHSDLSAGILCEMFIIDAIICTHEGRSVIGSGIDYSTIADVIDSGQYYNYEANHNILSRKPSLLSLPVQYSSTQKQNGNRATDRRHKSEQMLDSPSSQLNLKNYSRSVPQSYSQSSPQPHSQFIPQPHSQSIPPSHSQSIPQSHSQPIPQSHSRSIPQSNSQSIPQSHSQSIPQTHPCYVQSQPQESVDQYHFRSYPHSSSFDVQASSERRLPSVPRPDLSIDLYNQKGIPCESDQYQHVYNQPPSTHGPEYPIHNQPHSLSGAGPSFSIEQHNSRYLDPSTDQPISGSSHSSCSSTGSVEGSPSQSILRTQQIGMQNSLNFQQSSASNQSQPYSLHEPPQSQANVQSQSLDNSHSEFQPFSQNQRLVEPHSQIQPHPIQSQQDQPQTYSKSELQSEIDFVHDKHDSNSDSRIQSLHSDSLTMAPESRSDFQSYSKMSNQESNLHSRSIQNPLQNQSDELQLQHSKFETNSKAQERNQDQSVLQSQLFLESQSNSMLDDQPQAHFDSQSNLIDTQSDSHHSDSNANNSELKKTSTPSIKVDLDLSTPEVLSTTQNIIKSLFGDDKEMGSMDSDAYNGTNDETVNGDNPIITSNRLTVPDQSVRIPTNKQQRPVLTQEASINEASSVQQQRTSSSELVSKSTVSLRSKTNQQSNQQSTSDKQSRQRSSTSINSDARSANDIIADIEAVKKECQMLSEKKTSLSQEQRRSLLLLKTGREKVEGSWKRKYLHEKSVTTQLEDKIKSTRKMIDAILTATTGSSNGSKGYSINGPSEIANIRNQCLRMEQEIDQLQKQLKKTQKMLAVESEIKEHTLSQVKMTRKQLIEKNIEYGRSFSSRVRME